MSSFELSRWAILVEIGALAVGYSSPVPASGGERFDCRARKRLGNPAGRRFDQRRDVDANATERALRRTRIG